jgi:hypothetical protein
VTAGTLHNSELLGNDEAMIVVSQWIAAEQGLGDRPLAALLSLGRGGRNVQRIGKAVDIAAAAQVNRFDLVAELGRDPLRIVAV